MGNLGPGEILVILLVALIVFGPRKLPELGKSLGAGLREFRRTTQGLKDELDVGLSSAPPAARPGPAPVQTIHVTPDPATLAPTVAPDVTLQGPVPAAALTPPARPAPAADPKDTRQG